MEIVLCGWNEDIESILQVENYSWVLVTDPVGAAADELFSSLSRRDAKVGGSRMGWRMPGARFIHANISACKEPPPLYRCRRRKGHVQIR